MLALTTGAGDELVLRLMTREPWRSHGAGLTTRESEVQQMLAPTTVPAPRSRALDAHGRACGFPGHLMSLLPGQVDLDRVDEDPSTDWRTCWPASMTFRRRSRSAPTSRGPGRRSTPSRPGRRTQDCGKRRSRCSAPIRRTTSPASSTATSSPATCSGPTTGSAAWSTGSRRRWARRGWTSRTAAPTSPSTTAAIPRTGSPRPTSPARVGNPGLLRCHGHRRVSSSSRTIRIHQGGGRASKARATALVGHAARGPAPLMVLMLVSPAQAQRSDRRPTALGAGSRSRHHRRVLRPNHRGQARSVPRDRRTSEGTGCAIERACGRPPSKAAT